MATNTFEEVFGFFMAPSKAFKICREEIYYIVTNSDVGKTIKKQYLDRTIFQDQNYAKQDKD